MGGGQGAGRWYREELQLRMGGAVKSQVPPLGLALVLTSTDARGDGAEGIFKPCQRCQMASSCIDSRLQEW